MAEHDIAATVAHFDPARMGRTIAAMTVAQSKALLAIPGGSSWATASELKSKATAASLDVLYISHRGDNRLCDRRWTRWGSEPGQKRGQGYEYTLTPYGEAVRQNVIERRETRP